MNSDRWDWPPWMSSQGELKGEHVFTLWTPVLFCRGDVSYIIWREVRVSSQLGVNHLQSSLFGLRPRQVGKATYSGDSAVTSLFDLKDKRDVFTRCANCYIRQSQNSNVQSGVRQVAFHIVIQGSSSFSEVLRSSTQDVKIILESSISKWGKREENFLSP